MFTGWERPSHWLVLGVVVVVLFGYKKLPDAARSVGRSLRIFKTEIKGMSEDDKARAKAREEAEQKALPAAEVVKRDTGEQPSAAPEPPRARSRPSPNGQAQATAKTE